MEGDEREDEIEVGVALLRAGIDILLKSNVTALSSTRFTAVQAEIETERRRLEPVDHHLLAQLVDRGIAGEYGRSSPADLLVELLRITPGEAKARLRRAAELGPRQTLTGLALDPILPATAEAVAAGAISGAHADVIIRAVQAIPDDLEAEFGVLVEHALVDQARHTHPGQVARAAQQLLERINPDGSHTPHGRLTPEAGAVWNAILGSLAKPQPAEDGTPDPRTAGQRRHDALLDAGKRLMRSDLPATGGTPVTILVLMRIEDFRTGTAQTATVDLTAQPTPSTGPNSAGCAEGSSSRSVVGLARPTEERGRERIATDDDPTTAPGPDRTATDHPTDTNPTETSHKPFRRNGEPSPQMGTNNGEEHFFLGADLGLGFGRTPMNAPRSKIVSIDSAPRPERPERADRTQAPLPLPPTDRTRTERAVITIPPPNETGRAAGVQSPRRAGTSARLVLGAVVVAGMAVVAVAYATTHSDRTTVTASHGTAAAPAGAAPSIRTSVPLSPMQANQRDALTWMAANVPHRATVLTEPTLSGRLTSLGFASVRTTPGGSVPAYVLSDGALRLDTDAGTVLSQSVPVARFGTSHAVVEVRSVLTVTAARVAQALAADLAHRRMAGVALATNPKLSLSDDERAVLRNGELDLRAATFLALAASDTPVRVVGLPTDPAETAATRPRRTVIVAAGATATAALRAYAAALPANYAPMTIKSDTPGSLTLTWSPTAQPVQLVT